jgi:uncharacterized protein YqjF (DUF2071 family)
MEGEQRMIEHSRPFLTARWQNLIMLTYAVDPRSIIDRVPAGTTLDSYHGKALVSLIGFQFLDTKVLGAPVPFHQDFEEVNLRFYVKRVADDGVRSGVVFLCEVVPRPVVGGMARLLYREPYIVAPMRSNVVDGPTPDAEYQWQIKDRWQTLAARASQGGSPPAPGSIEEFVMIRHWGYNGEARKDTIEYKVDHPAWRVWKAKDVRVEVEAEAICGHEIASQLKNPISSLVADGSAVTIHWRTQLEG